MVETATLTPGAHFLHWETELQPELNRRKISYALAQRCGSQHQAEQYFLTNPHLIEWYHGSERRRKARAQRGRCWYCGGVLNLDSVGQPESAELEHQTPRSRNLPVCSADHNKVTSCRSCNNPKGDGKGDRDLEEYRAFLLGRRHPGSSHLFFFGEWLALVDCGALSGAALERVARQTFQHPRRALAFPTSLLWEVQPMAANTDNRQGVR